MVKRHNEPILEERSIAEDQAGRELYDLNRKPLARRGTRDGGSDEPILYTSPLGGVSRPCLRAAKLEMIAKLRATPYEWAAFQLYSR